MLTPDELRRYQRQILLSELGREGQERLKNARVLVVGAGGLGCPVLLYLSGAGVGTLGLVDGDQVSESNLHRQILYGNSDVGRRKVEVTVQRLQEANPFVNLVPYAHHLDRHNALEILAAYDLVVDCTDNFAARYLINDACVLLNKPFVYGAIHRFEGQVAVFNCPDSTGQRGATYRCLFPEPPGPGQIPNCDEAGVIGVLPGLIGLYQANEAIKLITGLGHRLNGELLLLDLLEMTNRKIRIRRRPEAGQISGLIDYEAFCNKVTAQPMKTISASELAEQRQAGEAWVVIDVREPYEYDICHLPEARLVPMGEVLQRLREIPRDKPVVMYCHHGMRSASVIRVLEEKGYTNLYNLIGGIDAWAVEVEEEMERY